MENKLESASRLDVLKGLVAQNPSDAFARYGLAMEYVKSSELEQAVNEFSAVIENNSGYAYAYFHGGQTLEKLARLDQAREWYEKGIQVSRAKGDQKALSELQAALDLLP